MDCLDCKRPLDTATRAEASYLRCPECGAAWMTEDTFRAAVAAVGGPDVKLVVDNTDARLRPCPACTAPMDVVWVDFLQLDRCPSHGIWFDSGELQKALGSNQGTDPGTPNRIPPDAWKAIFKR
ncbi:MAG: zf-TFIIB domain-containing protein [Deltaproteobacteria bacterium]|nr:zf-TFIIB domain-containing protein [Deltaproteobacteria bacterium]